MNVPVWIALIVLLVVLRFVFPWVRRRWLVREIRRLWDMLPLSARKRALDRYDAAEKLIAPSDGIGEPLGRPLTTSQRFEANIRASLFTGDGEWYEYDGYISLRLLLVVLMSEVTRPQQPGGVD